MTGKHDHIKVMIAGGGTGGHIFPAIAIANAIKRQNGNVEFLFVGAKGKMEIEKVPQAGFDIKGIDIAGFNRSSMLKNIALPYKILKSFWQVSKIINNYKPDAVIGVGGYSSYPVLKYAQSKGIKTFIHESNSFAGKANMMLGKKAVQVYTATAGMEKFFPAEKIVVTGNPVRSAIAESNVPRAIALAKFGLKPEFKTVLSVGGSLGAQSINEAIAENLEYFKNNNLQLIWQTGKLFVEKAASLSAGKSNVWAASFISNMEDAYAASDYVISRSGAMAVAELCIVGKPVVFVPYPFAAEDHQTANAKVLVDKNAARMVANDTVKTDLITALNEVVSDDRLASELSANIKQLAVKDADEQIATSILNHIYNA